MRIPLHVDCATGAILTNVSKVTKVYRSTFDYGVKNDRSQKTEKTGRHFAIIPLLWRQTYILDH